MKRILVIGSLNLDYTIDLKAIPRPGETVRGHSVTQIPGGKGANQAYGAGKMGGVVSMIGCLGEDDAGQTLLNNLCSVGVDTSGISIVPNATSGQAFIALEDSGENSIIIIPGANQLVTPAIIQQNIHLIDACDYILMQFEIPLETVSYVIQLAREKNKRVILDPAPAISQLDDGFWQGIYLLKPNETELEILSGRSLRCQEDYITAARDLVAKGVEHVIVTLGSNGCLLVTESEATHFPGHPVVARDTTAAGDCFTAAMAVSLSEGHSLSRSIHFAQLASSIAVTRKGAQTSIPSRNELDMEVSFEN